VDARKLVTRMTICKVRGHKWTSVRYPSSEEEAPGRFARCSACGKESHRHTGTTFSGPGSPAA
jgi:hypothetical protein